MKIAIWIAVLILIAAVRVFCELRYVKNEQKKEAKAHREWLNRKGASDR